MMAFVLGSKSLANLEGVHPVLVKIVKRAIEITEQDFGVYEGVRTIERQRKLVASGASKTLNSMHIPGPDRLSTKIGGIIGHAVDLVPWIDGQFRWEWGPCFKIACAVDRAATEQLVADSVCWGGVWDRWLSQYGDSAEAMKAEVDAYSRRHPGPDFVDGPHYQVGRLG